MSTIRINNAVILLLLFLHALPALSQTTVKPKITASENTLVVDSVGAISVYSMNFSAVNPHYTGSIEYPVIQLNHSRQLVVSDSLWADSAYRELTQNIHELSKQPRCGKAFGEYHYECTPVFLTPVLFSYYITIDESAFCSGHSDSRVRCRTGLVATGKFLSLSDLFNVQDSALWEKKLAEGVATYYPEYLTKPAASALIFSPGFYAGYPDFAISPGFLKIHFSNMDSGGDQPEGVWVDIPFEYFGKSLRSDLFR